ncbi:MAG: adenylate/guanylate cyclase domain-containing protein [Flavobacteriales bacterium]|nr:adenylate/guanylate cyclase domain-containing protein [Flavobacteriales bacterium]
MKKLLLFCLIIAPILVFGTNDERIQQLEETLEGLQGKRYAKQCMKLSRLYFDEKQYDRAYNVAKLGYQESRREHLDDYEGITLNQAARVLIERENTTLDDLDMAEKDLKLAKSILDKTDYNKLQMDNNSLFRKLENRRTELKNPGQQPSGLEAIKENISGIFSKRTDTEQPENTEPGSSSRRPPGERIYDNEYLLRQLQMQQSMIQNLNQDQLKQRYLLLEKNRLIDSMNMVGFLDSMELDFNRLQLKESEYKLREKNSELLLEKSRKRTFILLFGLIIAVALGLTYMFLNTRRFNATLRQKNEEIELEKKKADDLLLNILPADIAKELKETGKSEAQHFQEATIIFTDFKDFTRISEQLNPAQLVEELNDCFKAFDSIVTKYNIEKIKTIGDAYMAVGGLNGDAEAAKNVVMAGIEMQEYIQNRKSRHSPNFEMRVGIHSGPVVAGIVGDKKFQYDIWGDSVNTASRMESSGEIGKVNISSATYLRIEDCPEFHFSARGQVAVKNKDNIEMYFVTRA